MVEATDGGTVECVRLPAQPAVSVRRTVALAELPRAQGEALRQVWSHLRQAGVEAAGPAYVRYHTFGADETDVEVGFPVTAATAERAGEPTTGVVRSTELPGGEAASTWHFGSHDGLRAAYERLGSWIDASGRSAAAPGWEVYTWIDPHTEPDPAKWPAPEQWRTELVQPLS